MIRRPPRSTLFPYTTLFRSPARQAATLLGTEHYEEVVTARDFANSLDSIIAATDLPSHDGVNTFFASRLAARHVKVVLNGDRKSTRLNSSHSQISYAVFCLK